MGTKFRNKLVRYDHASDIVSGLVNFRIIRTIGMMLLQKASKPKYHKEIFFRNYAIGLVIIAIVGICHLYSNGQRTSHCNLRGAIQQKYIQYQYRFFCNYSIYTWLIITKEVMDVEGRAIFEDIEICKVLLGSSYVATILLDGVLSFSYTVLIFL